MKGMITDIKRFAVHDGDGIRTTVFFKGCSLRCVWCHNPETIAFRPQMAFYADKCAHCGSCAEICGCHSMENQRHAFNSACCRGCGRCESACLHDALQLYGKEYTVDTLMPLLSEDRDFYGDDGGITLSGGECLCQIDFCEALLKRCKECGLNTAVDTCGNVPFSSFERVLPHTDTFLYDIKAIDERTHIRCTGHSNKHILENLRALDGLGAGIEIRIPYVPEYNSGEMEKIAAFVKELKNIRRVRVLPYHNYSKGRYAALSMEDTLPGRLPEKEEIAAAERFFDQREPSV